MPGHPANADNFPKIGQGLRKAIFLALLVLLGLSAAQAQTGRQDITLLEGWNAVWLEVEPVYPAGDPRAGLPKEPEDVFPNGVVTVVSPKPLAGLAEFFAEDPSTVGSFNQAGWEQWNRPAGIDDDLVTVSGKRPYLIETNGPLQFTLEGKATFHRPTWIPDRYNLVGFGINGTISFQDFFAPSGGSHPVGRIFSLAANGNWQVVNPSAAIGNNVAYWIFCNGPSRYMGPTAVDFRLASLGALNFGGPGDAVTVDSGPDALQLDLEEVVFTNLGSAPTTPALELITADPGTGQLDLHVVRPAASNLAHVRGNQVDSVPGDGQSSPLGETVAPRTTAVLTLGARRTWTSGEAGRTHLYRLTTGTPGARFWLPVTAINNDIQLPTDILPGSDAARVAGLWVGEISINAVTSIVENGAPTRPAAGSAPLRLLLHSNATGTVSLLSQVTLMQTKTADPNVTPIPVLLVDQARIPFFEGIEERDGKSVGLRLEAVAYDMPRRLDATSQAALLADFPQLTAAQIPGFLSSRTDRPPSLAEIYHFSWPLEGELGAGETVRTPATAPLVLDPFHRGNPFRHAFHQQHGRGPDISRMMEIVFDANQTIPGRLRGSFREVLQGVIKSDLELSGRLEMHRVSAVDTLDAAP